MAGRGQKRQLKQLMNNLHEMLRSLGEQDGSKLVLQVDQFQYLRQDFQTAATKYEKSNQELSNQSDRKQRGILIYEISSSKATMDRSLKKMTNLVLRMEQKLNKNKKKPLNSLPTKKKNEAEKLQNELQYKCLTIYHLQKTFFQLTKKEHRSVAKPQNFPDIQTIEELKLRKPLNRGFSQQSDHQSSQFLRQQQMLEALKSIDNRIEQKMDYILEGVKMLNYNALAISEGIDTIHKKILINVEKLDENLDQLQRAQDLLEEASPHVSKPNCIMNVIIVIFLAIIVFLIVNKLVTTESQNKDSIPKV